MVTEAANTDVSLSALEAEHRRIALQRDIARDRQELAAYTATKQLLEWGPSCPYPGGWGEFVPRSDYPDLDHPAFRSGYGYAQPSQIDDRRGGRYYPIFQNEQELAEIRGAARVLVATNSNAIGLLGALENYVIGKGFRYVVSAKGKEQPPDELLRLVQLIVDEFLERNEWDFEFEKELFRRSRRDGEYFLALYDVGDGLCEARTVEPEQVCAPYQPAAVGEYLGLERDDRAWSFGVHSDPEDAQATHGYFVTWSADRSEWSYMPGGKRPSVVPDADCYYLQHVRCNVDRSIKRGLSDFYAPGPEFERARKVLRNVGEGAAIVASIAYIRQHAAGTTQANVSTMASSLSSGTVQQPRLDGSTRSMSAERHYPGRVIDIPKGMEYQPPPAYGSAAIDLLAPHQAQLRSAGTRWNAPENIISGDASNNNFASILVAESPFVKGMESAQTFYGGKFTSVLWLVVRIAQESGRLGSQWLDMPLEKLRAMIEIKAESSQVSVREPLQETQRREVLFRAGVMSRKTWAAQEDLDPETEQQNIADDPAPPPSAGGLFGLPTGPTGEPGAPVNRPAGERPASAPSLSPAQRGAARGKLESAAKKSPKLVQLALLELAEEVYSDA